MSVEQAVYISTSIWKDKRIRSLSTTEAKLLYFRLLTHQGFAAAGTMQKTPAQLKAEIEWQWEGFYEAWNELVKAGLVLLQYYGEDCTLVLPDYGHFVRHHIED